MTKVPSIQECADKAAEDHVLHLSQYTPDQVRTLLAKESEYTPEEKQSLKQAVREAGGGTQAREDWQYKRALKLGLDPSIEKYEYEYLRDSWHGILQRPEGRNALDWVKENSESDSTLDYAHHASDMRKSLKEEQDDLRVKQYALQTKQFFLRLDPRLAKMFVLELTGTERGDWQKLFGHLDEIPDPPAKRLNPSYEKSKAFARTIRATHNLEQAILAAKKAWGTAKDWNKFLDDKAKLPVPALPSPKTPKALAIGESV